MGKKLEFTETSEPTDIIWENRHWTKKEIFWRSIFAWVIILILMAGSFIFIWWVSAFSTSVARVFPTVDCEAALQTYGSEIEEFAVADYDFIKSHPGKQS